MSSAFQMSRALLIAALAAAVAGCGEEAAGTGAASAQSAKVAPTVTAAATAAVVPSVTATAAATAVAAPTRPCPKDSAGEGSLKAPCEAKGLNRMMEVTWTGKMDDKGPSFRVVNKSKTLTILFGKIAVYFYDKAGKQLEVPDASDPKAKPRPNQLCSGNLFSGIMKPEEKAVVTFSCVPKKSVPEGAVAIEAEMQVVGFADDTEKKSDLYWKNTDLTPDVRAKGGIKK